MAVELIDGRAGEPHVDGSDLGIFRSGLCGDKGGILQTTNKCAITVNSNTSVTIAEGEMVLPKGRDGRLVRIKSPETLTVTTGTASQKRNDLVVCRYSKDASTEIETASLVVVRGTPTTGTPSDPYVSANDLKLYRLPLNGLTLGAPIKLAEDIMPIMGAHTKKLWTGETGIGASITISGLFDYSEIGIAWKENQGIRWFYCPGSTVQYEDTVTFADTNHWLSVQPYYIKIESNKLSLIKHKYDVFSLGVSEASGTIGNYAKTAALQSRPVVAVYGRV